jgi:signal transduction histidine kinase
VLLQGAVTEAIARAGLGETGAVRVNAVLPGEPLLALAGPSLPGIIWNLLDNAAKAMPAGGTITVRALRGPGPDRVTLEVEDEGIGIEPWRLSSIFEPAASTTANSYAPTHGLGLWWTKGQVESFGGTIEVSSEPGVGTRFRLIFRTAG